MSSQETFSITTLQRMCARSEYLDESDIHMNDKTVSWDGNIIYYKTKKPASTGNEFLIPIQVKGKEYNTLPDSDKGPLLYLPEAVRVSVQKKSYRCV